jgi:Carbon-nitrogen hydrolase
MANYLKISTLGPAWHAVPEHLSNEQIIDEMITFWKKQFAQVLYDKPDLIVVPECCDIPANMPTGERRIEYYKVRKNRVLDYFRQVARKNRCHIVYASNIFMPDNTLRNAAIMINRNGDIIGSYNKNHLVPEENEQEDIVYGRKASIIECDFGRVVFAICFDLNFAELRLKYAEQKPDLIIFPSLYHGGLMQSYWAYSCRCHFVGAIAGGACEIRKPFGEVVASTTNYRSFATTTVNLDCCLVKRDLDEGCYAKIKAEYGSDVSIEVPPNLGVTLISSETDKTTAREVMQKYKIPTLDEFFVDVLKHRKQQLTTKE